MPCMSDGPTTADYAYSSAMDAKDAIKALQKQLNDMEGAMCALCKMVDDAQPGSLPQEMHHWWLEHRRRPGCTQGAAR